MKNLLFAGSIAFALCLAACADSTESKSGAHTHTHDDGTVHTGHAADTTKPVQEEFTVGDTTHGTQSGAHTHEDGHTHSH